MKIEYLYPELGNLFGDSGNFRYLRLCLPQAQAVMTHLGDKPAFLKGDAALTYCGSMTEDGQSLAIRALSAYGPDIRKAIDTGARMLFTGNAMELFGTAITDGDRTVAGLGLMPLTAQRHLDSRTNGFFLGPTADGIMLTAFTSRGSDITADDMAPFATSQRGYGRHPGDSREGVVDHNFIGTNLLGPLLALNPDFTAGLLKAMGSDAAPAFLDQARQAYALRLNEFSNPKVAIDE